MGSQKEYPGVRKASNSSIEVRFTYPTPDVPQKERIKLKPTPDNLKTAYLFLEEVKQAIEDGTFDYAVSFPQSKRARNYQNRRLLVTYMRRWLTNHRYEYHASSYTKNMCIIENQLGWLGRKRLAELTYGDVVKWIRDQKIVQKTANNKVSLIRGALRAAVEEGEINVSPLEGKPPPKAKVHRRVSVDEANEEEIDPFSREEIKAILDATDFLQHRYLLQFGFATGLRISELIALRWKQVDFTNKMIKVDRKRTVHSEEDELPKTKASKRYVKLNKVALDALTQIKAFTFLEGQQVFLNPRTQRPFTGDNQIRDRFWKTALKKAGVRYRYPYQMRHTYASTSLQLGSSPYFVTAQLGHTKPSFTMDTYSRYIPANNLTDGDEFDDFMETTMVGSKPNPVYQLKSTKKGA